MNNIENQKLSATLSTLKDGVNKATSILIDMLDNNKSRLKIDESQVNAIVSLLVFDAEVKEDIKYSILQDFEFTKFGEVIVQNKNFNDAKNKLIFLDNYLNYRINNPVDLAKC